MSRRGKQLAAEREWREMPTRQQRSFPQPKNRSRFTLGHLVLAVAVLLAVAVIDYFAPTLRGFFS